MLSLFSHSVCSILLVFVVSTEHLAKVLLGLPGTITNRGDNHTADALLQRLDSNLVALGNLHIALDGLVLPANLVTQECLESAGHPLLILGKVVDDSVGASVESVTADDLACGVVDGVAQPDGRAGGVVHVEDWRGGVEAGGVEVVGVFHGKSSEGFEIAVVDRLLHSDHALGDDVVGALLEEGRSGDGGLHAGGGRDILLLGAGNEDAGAHVGPVAGGSDFVCQAVTTILLFTLLPASIAAEQTPASRARALTSDLAEVGGSSGELVEIGDGTDESSEACCAGGETSGGGEVVLRDDLEVQVGKLGKAVILDLDILS